MADQVQLHVSLQGAEQAIADLSRIDAYVKSLNGKSVKIKVSSSGMTRAATQAEKLNTNLGNAVNAAQQLGTSGAKAVNTTAAATEKAATSAQRFNIGFGSMAGNLLKFQAVNFAINGTIQAFKFAFQEMKNVDTELVNIRKVTGFTNDEIEKLSKNAYSLATNYGRQASEVLTASTTFARAGYTEQIGQLSELSLLLQNAGDLSADDAAKFIIATDKAYKLGGSYEDLIAVIDGLDNITNKNATDMQKMTDGMTIAGSVFAESGESIQTFAALLGAATANTQRSGSEVARALRTIFMNLRQIRGETEDGELIDGESIAAASKALKDYAGISTMENGQLRKASDVLTELAGKWDTLSETQRAAVSEAVAGKRQANILMALMGDWESVEKMMGEYANASGTAAKENAAYMDSWAAKTAQVKAAWTELVSGIVETDGIKGVLGFATDTLGLLNDVFQSPAVNKALSGLNTFLTGTVNLIDALVQNTSELFDTADERLDKAKKKSDDYANEAKTLLENYTKNFGEGSRYDELRKNVDNLTESERIELGLLEQEREEQEKQLELAKEKAKQAADNVKKREQEAADNRSNQAMAMADSFGIDLKNASSAFSASRDVDTYKSDLTDIISLYRDYYDTVSATRASGRELLDEEQRFLDGYENLLLTYTEGGNALEVYGRNVAAAALAAGASMEDAAALGNKAMADLANSLHEAGESIPDIEVAVKVTGAAEAEAEMDRLAAKAAAGASMTISVGISKLAGLDGIQHNASGTRFAPGGPSVVNENGPELIAAKGLAWIAGGGEPTVTMLPRGATVLTAEQTRRAMRGSNYGAIPSFADGTNGGNSISVSVPELPQLVDAISDLIAGERAYRPISASDLQRGGGYVKLENEKGIGKYNPKYCPVCGTPNPRNAKRCIACGYNFYAAKDAREHEKTDGTEYFDGGSSATPPNFSQLEKELEDRLKNLKLQAELAENQEDFLKAMEIYGEAQDYISELLNLYRANGYAEDSNEVLKLANLGYDFAGKQLGDYDKLQKALIEALNGLTEATEDANALAEKQEGVDKAREALANAEKQRTVRIFNPVTGQWEWVANAADVQKAQENLQKAQDSLQKEQLDQTLKAIKNAKPEDLAGLTLTPAVLDYLFNGTPEQQSAFLDALNAATGGADYLGSAEAQTEFNQGNNIGTQWNLNGITLTEDQAKGMTIQDLLNMLQGLKMM